MSHNLKPNNNFSNIQKNKKGILFIENIDDHLKFNVLRKMFQKFGKINKIFFYRFYKKNKNNLFNGSPQILAWIQFFNKIDAKKASACFQLILKCIANFKKPIAIKYVKAYEWHNIATIVKKNKQNIRVRTLSCKNK